MVRCGYGGAAAVCQLDVREGRPPVSTGRHQRHSPVVGAGRTHLPGGVPQPDLRARQGIPQLRQCHPGINIYYIKHISLTNFLKEPFYGRMSQRYSNSYYDSKDTKY